jgi:ethanolamine utilization protein EutM
VELASPIIKLDGGVVSVQVIPRPHEDLGGVLSFTKAQTAAAGKSGSNGGA